MMDGTTTEDILDLPLDRFLNRVLAWMRARMAEGDWRSFLFRLEVPPLDVSPTSGPWSEEEMAKTWERLEDG